MSSLHTLLIFFFFFFLTSFTASAQNPIYAYHSCPNTTIYTKNSAYYTNLRSLLVSFSSDTASYTAGYQNTAAGQSPDLVIGFFLCRGDFSPEVCRSCVRYAVNDTLIRCPNEKEVLIWYVECMLRYSYRNVLLNSETSDWVFLSNETVPSNQIDRMNSVLVKLLNDATDVASTHPKKFWANHANFSSSQSLYGLVQCLPDITSQECRTCLLRGISRLPRNTTRGRFLYGSCYLRFDDNLFYNQSSVEAPPPSRDKDKKSSTATIIAVVVSIAAAVVLAVVAAYIYRKRKAKETYNKTPATPTSGADDDITTTGSLQFDLKTIQAATDYFCHSNRIGQGGFGEVYRGVLPDGTPVAVKRLLKTTSEQRENEFKNEVVLVAKLQHRNLVRLLGFCLQGEEKILVFECMPNKSLDFFLFDPARKGELDWTRRYKIIGGVARGILYLHQDSRLTIIHRDLKANNILLDADMNPKIADFGMARLFGMHQTEAKTKRVIGTYGYMAPEYAMYGQFSMKSDVYSFGILALEILSGKRNSSFHEEDDVFGNLVTYVWRLWSSGSPLELMDPAIGDKYSSYDAIRCVHIGLLCVQEDPADRPTMSTIVQMLTTSSIALPVPRPPGFFFRNRNRKDQLRDRSSSKSVIVSLDDNSITAVQPR